MKALYLLIIMFFPAFVYSQTKDDYRQIIEMVVNQRHDTVKNIYYQFDNKLLVEELKIKELGQWNLFYSYYEKHKDSLQAIDKDWFLNNLESTDTCSYYGVLLNCSEAIDICNKTNNKSVRPYFKFKVVKNKKTLPLMRISIPVFSVDGTMAIANYDFRCKGYYCGDTQFFIFKKANNVWEITGTGPGILY